MSGERLGPREWVNAGLRALSRSGFTALKAESLSKSLGVSRGSFYWHFADVGAFQAAVLMLGGLKLAWMSAQEMGVVSVASCTPTSGWKFGYAGMSQGCCQPA